MRSRAFFLALLLVLVALTLYTNASDVTTTTSPGGVGDDDTLPTAPPAHKPEAKSPNPLCIDDEEKAAIFSLILLVMLAACLVATYLLLKFHLHWFPESVLIIVIGILLGLALTVYPEDFNIITQLDPNIFFQIFLPAIIFDAGYTLEKQPFFSNIGGIIVYAVIGTILSTVVVACGLFLLGTWGVSEDLPLVDALMFGSLISAVDPVATLAIFSALKVNPILHYLVFGESIVNDAVAIVLFKTFEGFKHSVDASTTYLVIVGFIQFFYVSIGSVLLGIVMSLLASLFFKHIAVRKYPALELIFFVIFVYGPYLAALPYLSGILTILVSGVVMSYYTAPNLSLTTQATVTNGARALAFCSEALTFLYVGMALFSFNAGNWSPKLIAWTILLCLLGRALNVYPLTGVLNQFRRTPIDFKTQFIMFFSGLRGAIAFALSIGIKPGGDIGEYLFTTTIIVVLFTIVVFGGGTYPLLKIFKIKTKKEFDDELELLEKNQPQGVKVENKNILVKWDEQFLYRFFVRVDAQAPAVQLGDQLMLRSKFEKLGGRREFDLAANPGAEHIIVNDRDARLYDEDLQDINAEVSPDSPTPEAQPSVTIRVDLPRARSRQRSSSVDYSGRPQRSTNKLVSDPSGKVELLVKGMMSDPKKAKIYGEALALHYRRVKNLHDIVDNRYSTGDE